VGRSRHALTIQPGPADDVRPVPLVLGASEHPGSNEGEPSSGSQAPRWVESAAVGRVNQLFRLLRFVLEWQLDLGPVHQSPTVTNDDVLLRHLGHSDIPHRSPGCGYCLCRRRLPRAGARPDHVDHPVHAHDDLPSLLVDLSMVVASFESIHGDPILLVWPGLGVVSVRPPAGCRPQRPPPVAPLLHRIKAWVLPPPQLTRWSRESCTEVTMPLTCANA